VAAPAQTTSDALDPTAAADPIALAAFVARRGGRVLAYMDAVTQPDRALTAASEAFAAFRLARAADPDAEAAATTLLRATRRAAAAHAENPYRPDGRERPARRTGACDAMPRLLVAWTESRLPDDDVARLVEHLQGCPDCRALRDAFDRAELRHRGGEAADLDGTEVGVIATAMAQAVAPATAPVAAAPAADVPAAPKTPRPRRTAIPAPPAAGPALPAHSAARPPAPVGRRTAIPEPPTTAVPASERHPATTPAPEPITPKAPTPPHGGSGPALPEDPLGPEALGYAVPRKGLPRPPRRPVVPRVRRRRTRRPQSAAVAASVASDAVPETPVPTDGSATTTDAVPTTQPEVPTPSKTEIAQARAAEAAAEREAAARVRAEERATAERDAEEARQEAEDVRREAEEARRAADDAPAVGDTTTVAPGRPEDGAAVPDRDDDTSAQQPATPAIAPATVTSGGLTATGRRVLQVPIVRQLGVPAVLLLVVLIGALIAAGAFAGRQDDTVAPITRPTIPTVPADPSEIPPLR